MLSCLGCSYMLICLGFYFFSQIETKRLSGIREVIKNDFSIHVQNSTFLYSRWYKFKIGISARQNIYILIHYWNESVFLYFWNIQWPFLSGEENIQVKALMSLWFVFPPLGVILFTVVWITSKSYSFPRFTCPTACKSSFPLLQSLYLIARTVISRL